MQIPNFGIQPSLGGERETQLCAEERVFQQEGPDQPLRPSRTESCLKIVAVSLRDRFVRILNESVEETMDLGGFTLQQFERDFPVYLYRFPPHTLLAPQRHLTVRPAPPSPRAPPLAAPRRSPAPGAVPRCGARGLAAPSSGRPRPWAGSLSTSTPAGAW